LVLGTIRFSFKLEIRCEGDSGSAEHDINKGVTNTPSDEFYGLEGQLGGEGAVDPQFVMFLKLWKNLDEKGRSVLLSVAEGLAK